MFSIKVVGDGDHYTVYGCSAYNVGKTATNLRSISFWGKGSGDEPSIIIVDGPKTVVVYIMNEAGKTIDVIIPIDDS